MEVNKSPEKYNKTCTTVWLFVSKLQTESRTTTKLLKLSRAWRLTKYVTVISILSETMR